jgi:AhpD family alkylhydroperoxidase
MLAMTGLLQRSILCPALQDALTKGSITMLDWNTYKSELMKAIPEFGRLAPESLRGYQALSNAHAKDSHLGEKIRQLISLAVAVTVRCDGCIVIHSDAALKAGATSEEISEALGVAMAINAGAAFVYSLRTMDAANALTAPK